MNRLMLVFCLFCSFLAAQDGPRSARRPDRDGAPRQEQRLELRERLRERLEARRQQMDGQRGERRERGERGERRGGRAGRGEQGERHRPMRGRGERRDAMPEPRQRRGEPGVRGERAARLEQGMRLRARLRMLQARQRGDENRGALRGRRGDRREI